MKNCGDIVHMLVAERELPREMVKIVKKKVVYLIIVATIGSLLRSFATIPMMQSFIFAARFSCQREDININIYLARSFWRTKG